MAEIELEGDWYCPKCHKTNFARRTVCFACKAPKLGSQTGGGGVGGGNADRMLEGDWRCGDCGFHNFAKRDRCFGCNGSRYAPSLKGETMLKGDWICIHCKEHNFARRTVCFNCKVPRNTFTRAGYGGTKPAPQMLEGDWICSKCSEHNFARRTVCFACSLPRNPSTTPYAGIGRGLGGRGAAVGGRGIVRAQPDDWICLQCQGHNFAWRVVCFNCGTPKISRRAIVSRGRGVGRGRGRGGGGGGAGVIAPGDWICQACRSHNFARRQDCFSCGNAK